MLSYLQKYVFPAAIGLLSVCACDGTSTKIYSNSDPDPDNPYSSIEFVELANCQDIRFSWKSKEYSFRSLSSETPRSNPEAEMMALAITDAPVADEADYHVFLKDLAAIRTSVTAENQRVTDIEYQLHPLPGQALLSLKIEGVALYNSGKLQELDCIVKTLKIPKLRFESYGVSHLVSAEFPGFYQPFLIFSLFDAASDHLSYFGYVAFNNAGTLGNNTIRYSLEDDGSRRYLFWQGSGDCPSGCIYSEWWFYMADPSGPPVYIGHWNPEESPEPEWWKMAIDL